MQLPFDLLVAELGGGAVAMLATGSANSLAEAATLAVFGWSLLLLSLLDFRHFWLPNAVTLPLCLAGLLSSWVLPQPLIEERLAGMLFGYGSLTLIRLAYRRWRGHEGLGAGDAKLLAAIGAWLGVAALPGVVLAAALLALAGVGFCQLRGQHIDGTTPIPLGTSLAISAIGALAYSSPRLAFVFQHLVAASAAYRTLF